MIRPVKHVLWATDFSEESKEALAYADFFAKTFKAKLTALHVVPDFAPALYEAWPEVQAELTGRIESSKVAAKVKIDQMCEAGGACPNKTVVAEGSPSRIILQTAKKEGADLIVVGRKGISGHEQNLIGGVTHQILRGSRVPTFWLRRDTSLNPYQTTAMTSIRNSSLLALNNPMIPSIPAR